VGCHHSEGRHFSFEVRETCLLALIPAQKWVDTEIAERHRSLLVLRARCRWAVLDPHQRGWTDADGTASQLQLWNKQWQIVFFTTVFHLPLFCYAWGQHGLHGAQIMLHVIYVIRTLYGICILSLQYIWLSSGLSRCLARHLGSHPSTSHAECVCARTQTLTTHTHQQPVKKRGRSSFT